MPKRLPIVLVVLFLIAALLGPVIYANTRSAQENRSTAVSPQAQDAAPRVDKGAPPDAADPGAAPQTGQKAGENSSEAAGSGDLKVEEEKAGKRAGEAEENKAGDDGTGRKAPSTTAAAKPGNGVSLWVTTDFGRNHVCILNVPCQEGDSVLDLLKRHLRVGTTYGGGFVNEIEGIASGYTGLPGKERKKRDWFYWVNGGQPSFGAAQYKVSGGDVVWWDYHDWSATMYAPAIVGAYPEPFLHGFAGGGKGAKILFSPGSDRLAQELKIGMAALGIAPVSEEALREGAITGRTCPVVVLGTWEEIGENSTVAALFARGVKSGLYARFSGSEIELLSSQGTVVEKRGKGSGVVLATGTGDNVNPVWIVAGVDEEGVRRAVKLLSNHPLKIKFYFGAAVDAEKLTRLPVE